MNAGSTAVEGAYGRQRGESELLDVRIRETRAKTPKEATRALDGPHPVEISVKLVQLAVASRDVRGQGAGADSIRRAPLEPSLGVTASRRRVLVVGR